MPVYMRKQEGSIDLTKFEDDSPEIDEDFILDPDKFRDQLPQPYRFIDRVLESLLEVSFQEIFRREEEQSTEESRYKPPVVPTDLFRQVKDVSEVKYLTDSLDEKFVFCSASGRLLALGAVSMETVAKFESPDLEITSISVSRLNESVYLLATIDYRGLARLFLFDGTVFHLVKVLNEDEGEKRQICLELQLAEDGDFVALTLQNTTTQQVCLEFLRLPVDSWTKELEQQTGKAPAQKTAIAEERSGDAADTEETEDGGSANTDEASKQPQLKMSPPVAVLRVRPPTEVAASNAAAASTPNFKAVDSSGDVIGSGAQHLLTQAHLQLREANFVSMHSHEMEQLPVESIEDADILPTASVQFVSAGRCIGQDASSEQRVCAACVAWAGDHRVQVYSVLRSAKDIELKSDTVLSFSSPVTCISVSHCKSQLAVGQQNGNVSLHNLQLGLLRHVICVSSSQPISSVFWLNPAAFPEDGNDQIYNSERTVHAVAVTASNETFLLRVRAAEATVQLLPSAARHRSEDAALVSHSHSHPSLLQRTTNSGAVVLHDITLPQDALQLQLPAQWQMTEPWQRGQWTLANNGRSFFVRGFSEEAACDAVFYCNLRILIPMSKFWQRQLPLKSCAAECSLVTRNDAFLVARSQRHEERQKALTDIWSRLSETLAEVEAARMADNLADMQSTRSIHTALSSRSADSRMAKLQQLQQQREGKVTE